MAEPHSTAAAALAGSAAAIPAAGIAAALGVPLDLLGWAMFGGLVALANTEPKQPPREGLQMAVSVALRLGIAAGIGGAFAPIAGEVLVALSVKVGVALTPGAVLLRASSILLGFGTAFIPEAMRLARLKLGGPTS
jgi:hypothetical protein